MDAVFIDKNGNKKNFLYQYDVGQTFIVENFEYQKAPKAQFSIKSIKTMPSVSSRLIDGNLHVSIPDMLLTYGENIIAYLYIEDGQTGNTIETIFISVIPRKRPADYIYTDEMFVRSINGSTMAEKSGIAEVAEWEDSNSSNEDRCGYFVSVTYDKYNNRLVVKKATSLTNVYGVTVHETGFASNCADDQLNTAGYLLPQYAYVCTSGFAKVIDNGRCTVGAMCVPNYNGIAVPTSNHAGYKVVSRIDSSHILIFVDPSMHTMNSFQTSIDGTNNALNTHTIDVSNPHSVTKEQVGLGNADNTSDIDKPVSTAQAAAIADAKKAGIDAQTTSDNHKADMNNPHGVTAHQVGAYTKEETDTKIANLVDAAPGTLDTLNELAAALGDDPNFATTVATELGTKATKDELNVHVNDTNNPHAVTKTQIGLGNVDNTSDADKPVSTAQSSAISSAKTEVQNNLDAHINNVDNPHGVTKAQIGLGNVDNTSDINKPISTATQSELNKINNTLAVKADLVDGIVPLSQLPASHSPTAHADTHKSGGVDAIEPSDIGAASQADFDALKAKVDELSAFVQQFTNADEKQY